MDLETMIFFCIEIAFSTTMFFTKILLPTVFFAGIGTVYGLYKVKGEVGKWKKKK